MTGPSEVATVPFIILTWRVNTMLYTTYMTATNKKESLVINKMMGSGANKLDVRSGILVGNSLDGCIFGVIY